MFQQMQDDLGNAGILTLNASELHVLSMACQQCSHAAIKLTRNGLMKLLPHRHLEPNKNGYVDG